MHAHGHCAMCSDPTTSSDPLLEGAAVIPIRLARKLRLRSESLTRSLCPGSRQSLVPETRVHIPIWLLTCYLGQVTASLGLRLFPVCKTGMRRAVPSISVTRIKGDNTFEPLSTVCDTNCPVHEMHIHYYTIIF